jgi:hypothetical protein
MVHGPEPFHGQQRHDGGPETEDHPAPDQQVPGRAAGLDGTMPGDRTSARRFSSATACWIAVAAKVLASRAASLGSSLTTLTLLFTVGGGISTRTASLSISRSAPVSWEIRVRVAGAVRKARYFVANTWIESAVSFPLSRGSKVR